jgi:CRISPR system Cascade subunit CasE
MNPLHLTQIMVSVEDAMRRLRIRDSYDWHQHVWKAFPQRDGEERNFLIRVDRKEDLFRVWILSRSVPARPEWCPADGYATKVVSDAYFGHDRYRFSLLANPTRKKKALNPDGSAKKNGRREPIRTNADLAAWLHRKAAAGGFAVEADSLRILPRGNEFFSKTGARGTHAAVEFQGTLTVCDHERFRAACETGIGSAKAFGFGLLAITPLEN